MVAIFDESSTALPPNDIANLILGFELSLRARNRSPKTIQGYVLTVGLFREFLVGVGMPTAADKVERLHVEAFIADQVERWKPKTAAVRYGDLRQFFNWAVRDRECPAHPMSEMKPPVVPEVPVPVVSDHDLRVLLNACTGADFDCRRDTAIIRVFQDCGLRLNELTGLTVEDVDFDLQVLVVLASTADPAAYRSA